MPHNMKVDCWAVGVIAFQLLSGKMPFSARNDQSLYWSIRNNEPRFDLLGNVSRDAKRFIKACLTKEPRKRPDAEALLDYNWIKEQPD